MSAPEGPGGDGGGDPAGGPDWGALVKQAQQMQARVAQLQQELARRSVEGSAGGGMVTAVATGELRIREIRIEPSLFEGDDRAMVQDLVAAAVNAALAAAQKMVQEEMQRVAGQATLNLRFQPGPGSGSGPGSGPGPG